MKAPSFVLVTALALGLLTALPAEAAKANKAGRGDRQGKRMLAHFDTNHDGTIDTNEAARLRTAFDVLKTVDTNNDGKLSDEEIAATKVPQIKGGRAGKAGKRGARKNKA